MMHPLDKPEDLDEAVLDGDAKFEVPYEADYFRPPAGYREERGDQYLKYGIAVALVLHVAFFVLLPHVVKVSPPKSFIKAGENVTPVRIVEFLNPRSAEEKPPEDASAISDRNHTVQQERLPKPTPRSLLGAIAPPPRIAALAPPQAPEELEKSEPEQVEEPPEPKPTPSRKPAAKKTPETKKPATAQNGREQLRNRSVDLRPTRQEIARALSGVGDGRDLYPDGDAEEAVVDINTREVGFFSYLLHLKRKIEGVWVYPSIAAQSGIGGELTVEFLIANSGQLMNVSLMDSSGSAILDESAVKAIRSAAPYHPFPPSLKSKRLRVRAKFIYITQSSFRRIM
ncbi:MAG: TonB family protein [Desulfomonile sp.]|nr:TonB family protein [Desulfomonile sp.]